MSISTVPYTCPRRSAKSSTPSTATAPTGGSGSLRTVRSSVLRLATSPSRAPSRAAARPARANPAAASIRPNSTLRRAYREVNPGICSANVRFGQSAASQNSRRTPRVIATGVPPIGASATRRR
jgi:hypothetical protein